MRTIRHRTSALVTALALGAVGGLATALPAHAGTWVADVANPADDGSATTLRAAVDRANSTAGDWTIRLRPGTTYVIDRLCQHGGLDDDHGGDLDITTDDDVAIVGGAGTTIAVQCAGERAVHHLGSGTLRLEQLTVTGGNTADGADGKALGDHDGRAAGAGGAVLSTGTVVVRRGRLSGNRTGHGGNGAKSLVFGTGGTGGDGGQGAAVYASSVTLTDTVVEGNTSGDGGAGAVGNGAGNDGGAGGNGGHGAVVANSVTLERTTVRDNAAGTGGRGGDSASGGHAGDGGTGGFGGGVWGMGVRATASTFTGNRAGRGGNGGDGIGGGFPGRGGDGGNGGGMVVAGGPVVERSTVHANVAGGRGNPGTGAGLVPSALAGKGGGVAAGGAATIAWSTITANSAATAANVQATAASTLTASVIGERAGGGSDCSNALTSLGGNVVETLACGVGPDDRVIADVDAALSDLVDSAGPTPTRLPWPDGALAGAIPPDRCAELLGGGVHADQRGEPRPYGEGCEPGAVEIGPAGASSFEPLPPTRAFDTREPGSMHGAFAAGETRTFSFMGALGIPMKGATAIAMNVTVTDAAGPGFVTVWPPDGERPLASSLNTVRAGQTVPNFVIVPLGTDARVNFYAQTGGHVVVDVVGYFVPAIAPSHGRIVPVAPQRFFDTRTTDDGPGISGKLGPGDERWVSVTSEIGLPNVAHIAAVVMNVTATEATAAGYVTFWAHGEPRPLASTLNLAGPGDTSANLTIVPVGADGGISMFTQSGAHLLADIVGYVTDDTAPKSSQGLFVPLTPARVFDTRAGVPAGGSVSAGEAIVAPFAGVAGIPVWAGAAVMNVTATEAAGAGFVTGWPGALDRPLASTLNLNHAGETRANGSIMPIGTDGAIDFYSQSGTHLLADVAGYLLPDPAVLTGA